MSTVEDELVRAFRRHEALTPEPEPVRAAIAAGVRRRRVRRGALASGAAALLVVLVLLGVQVAARPTAVDPLLGATDPAAGSVTNFLLVGHDERDLADAVVLVHRDRRAGLIYLMSIPRDLAVGDTKLNRVYARGGYDALARTVAELTGVRIDGGATVSMDAARRITDAVGGVDMCVKEPVRSIHTGVTYHGCHVYSGAQAVDILRQRWNGGVIERDTNIRRYVRSMVSRAADPRVATDPVRVGQILAAAGSGLRLYPGPHVAAGLARQLGEVDPNDVFSAAVPFRERQAADGEVVVDLTEPEVFAALREGRLADWIRTHPAQ